MTPLTSHKREREETKKVLIYNDEGTNQSSLKAIESQLDKMTFTSKMVNSHYLKTKNWEKKTHLLIMGGGENRFWELSLGMEGMLRIANFVRRGGRYLGICAGAYFAASQSIFCQNGAQTIKKSRPLAFYQGTATGPINRSSNYLSLQAALAAKVDLLSQEGICYYQGGCSFDIHEDTPTTKVLGRYQQPYEGSCIISCQVEEGKAVLCGLHPEFLWEESLATAQTLSAFYNLVQTLSPYEAFRQEVWKTMLSELAT